jgi:hypothetical protein
MDSRSRKDLLLRMNLAIATFSGLLTLWQMTREPSEQQAALFLGFSLPRFIIFLVIILFILSSLLLFALSYKRDFWARRIGRIVNLLFEQSGVALASLVLMILLYLALFSTEDTLGNLASYRNRLYPFILWSTTLVMQLLLTHLILKIPGKPVFRFYRDAFVVALIAFMGFGILTVFIAATRIGLKPDIVLWQEAGTPLLFPQVILAWGTGFGLFLIFQAKTTAGWVGRFKFLGGRYLELLACLSLWVLAYSLWISYPLRPSYNVSGPSAPNFQNYPLADAMIYDVNAQEFLVGIPIPNDFTQKPFYSFFLVWLHALAGQNYDHIIQLQVAFYAFIPIICYLLVKEISTRPAGWIAAILVILRERNSLSLSNVIQVSHSKLLMGDVFAIGLMMLLVLFTIYWLKYSDKHRMLPMIIGGVLGIFVLSRLNSILLFPFLVLAFVLILIPSCQYRRFLEGTILLAIGLSIPLGIWIWRNYQWTGKLLVQEPVAHYTQFIASIYSQEPEKAPALLPGEDYQAYYHRIQAQPITFIKQHPGEVARFVSAHYVHNTIYSLFYLPNSLVVESTKSYVKRMPFWSGWEGQLSSEMTGFLLFNLSILSFGISLIWRRSKYLTVIPIFLGGGYNLSVALGRVSGWRFIMPSDWITLIFYAAGLMQIAYILYSFLTKKLIAIHSMTITSSDDSRLTPRNWFEFAIIGLVMVGLSLGLTMGHNLFPKKYSQKPPLLSAYAELFLEHGTPFPTQQLREFLAADGSLAIVGRGLYPSYLHANEGELYWWYLAYAPRPYDRLAFVVIGPDKLGVIGPDEISVVLPLNSKPGYFPDAAEVIAFGCVEDNEYAPQFPGYIDALLVVVNSSPPVVYIREPVPDLKCPFPEPSSH